MFRLWGKIWKDNHMIKDTVICNDEQDTRTHKVFKALEETYSITAAAVKSIYGI